MTRQAIARGGLTRAAMQRLVFSNRQYAGELMRDRLVRLCRSLPGGLAPRSAGGPVRLGSACAVLARWDGHENLRSGGAILFRRFLAHAFAADRLFVTPFSVQDPIATPDTLNAADPTVRTALGDAIADLRGAGIPLGAAPGDVQRRAGIPIHGGPGDPYGQFNAIGAEWRGRRGFGPVEHGSSYVQVVTWNRGSCPDARTILTYSESPNPRSPFFRDQTRLFSRKRWLTDRFCRRDVLRSTRSVRVLSAH